MSQIKRNTSARAIIALALLGLCVIQVASSFVLATGDPGGDTCATKQDSSITQNCTLTDPDSDRNCYCSGSIVITYTYKPTGKCTGGKTCKDLGSVNDVLSLSATCSGSTGVGCSQLHCTFTNTHQTTGLRPNYGCK
jgi:hypothetical protein